MQTVISLLLFGIATPLAAAADLPRFRFEPGLELVYRTSNPPRERENADGGKSVSQSNTEMTVRVIRALPDGGHRLVIHEQFVYEESGRAEKTRDVSDKYGYLNMGADGQIGQTYPPLQVFDPSQLFPPLPPASDMMPTEWNVKLPFKNTRREMRTLETPASEAGRVFRFQERRQDTRTDVMGMDHQYDYEFDPVRGCIECVTSTISWPENPDTKPMTTVLRLADTRMIGADELRTMGEEVDFYFAAAAAYDRLVDEASFNFSDTDRLLQQARETLEELKAKLTLPLTQGMLAAQFAQLENDEEILRQVAPQFRKVLDQPSPNWQTTDLDGKPHSLADYRGRVVVLDFWYRACGWCMVAMPEVCQLAKDFADDKISILGINNDPERANADRVIQKLQVPYPTLKNHLSEDETIHGKYKVQGWPTVIVIDPQGIVRRIHFGYTSNMRRELAKVIQQLLVDVQE